VGGEILGRRQQREVELLGNHAGFSSASKGGQYLIAQSAPCECLTRFAV
jgi:hypothetical protein